jgi:hypothetical protein
MLNILFNFIYNISKILIFWPGFICMEIEGIEICLLLELKKLFLFYADVLVIF